MPGCVTGTGVAESLQYFVWGWGGMLPNAGAARIGDEFAKGARQAERHGLISSPA